MIRKAGNLFQGGFMRKCRGQFHAFLADETGVTAIEYSLIAAIMATVSIAMASLGDALITSYYDDIAAIF